MSITIVGGDRLGGIPKRLQQRGFLEINHVPGRSNLKLVKLRAHSDMILILTDFVATDLAHKIKREGKARGIPVICAKRSWSYIETAMGLYYNQTPSSTPLTGKNIV